MNILMLGIPFSINSGVVTVQKNLNKLFQMNGCNVVNVNHWWHQYSYFSRDLDKYIPVRLSPFSITLGDGTYIEHRWAFKHTLQTLKDNYNFYPSICHVHTHTFHNDNAIQVFHDYYPNVPIIFTVHAFLPYIKASKEDQLKILDNNLDDNEKMRIRKESFAGREKSQEKMFELADKIVFIAKVHKTAFDNLYPEYKQKSIFMNNGSDIYIYKNNIRTHNLPIKKKSNEKIIMYVGRVEAQKGARFLFNAFNEIAKVYPNTKLMLVGTSSEELNKIIDFGLSPNLLDNIIFTGWIKDKKELISYYLLADAMLQPVFSKNLYAMVAIEAMMVGIPVISCPGDLSFGTCESIDSVLSAINKIFNSQKLIQEHIIATQTRVLEEYSLNSLYIKYLKLYKNSIIKKNQTHPYIH